VSTLSDVISIRLTRDQSEQLAPIVRSAVGDRKHVLFIAAAVPSLRDEGVVWHLQVKPVDQKTSQKLKKLLADESVEIKRASDPVPAIIHRAP
jgi:hypothetical protein